MLIYFWCVIGELYVQYMLYDKFLSVLGFLESKLEAWKFSNGGNHKFYNLHSGDMRHRCDRVTVTHLGELKGVDMMRGLPSWSPRRASRSGVSRVTSM